MKTPIFAHGSLEGVNKLVEKGVIEYPAYCWVTDTNQYYFLNQDGVFEAIGIPERIGTLESPIIASDLGDGIHKVIGNYKITEDDSTLFSTGVYVVIIIETIDNVQKIKQITSDEITDYLVRNETIWKRNCYVTEDYLRDHGYATEEYVDVQLEAMKVFLEDELKDYVDIGIQTTVPEIVDDIMQPCGEDAIRNLFN